MSTWFLSCAILFLSCAHAVSAAAGKCGELVLCGSNCFDPVFESCCEGTVFQQVRATRGSFLARQHCCQPASGKAYIAFTCDDASKMPVKTTNSSVATAKPHRSVGLVMISVANATAEQPNTTSPRTTRSVVSTITTTTAAPVSTSPVPTSQGPSLSPTAGDYTDAPHLASHPPSTSPSTELPSTPSTWTTDAPAITAPGTLRPTETPYAPVSTQVDDLTPTPTGDDTVSPSSTSTSTPTTSTPTTPASTMPDLPVATPADDEVSQAGPATTSPQKALATSSPKASSAIRGYMTIVLTSVLVLWVL